MRRIVIFNWLTTDGYFAGPDGKLEWVVPDEEQAKAAARDIPGFDTVLFGRRTPSRAQPLYQHRGRRAPKRGLRADGRQEGRALARSDSRARSSAAMAPRRQRVDVSILKRSWRRARKPSRDVVVAPGR